jgi:hypothetical protein
LRDASQDDDDGDVGDSGMVEESAIDDSFNNGMMDEHGQDEIAVVDGEVFDDTADAIDVGDDSNVYMEDEGEMQDQGQDQIIEDEEEEEEDDEELVMALMLSQQQHQQDQDRQRQQHNEVPTTSTLAVEISMSVDESFS